MAACCYNAQLWEHLLERPDGGFQIVTGIDREVREEA
jgi:hypothetical protein